MNGRDHGGGIDAAAACFGGARAEWLDLSTGINPIPYPLPTFSAQDWTALPDAAATARLKTAARAFWNLPKEAAILAAPGASALIARLPGLAPAQPIAIPGPTYNEHAAAFRAAGWAITDSPPPEGGAQLVVHPNNPDGRTWGGLRPQGFTVIDESFCDVIPEQSLIELSQNPDVILLKSFGKFWGLAGLRLGFAIGAPKHIARLAQMLGPWPVAGPALRVGALALEDPAWAAATRARLLRDAARLDALVGWPVIGGTPLFRLYDTPDATATQARLAQGRVWSRIFPYSSRWLRLGLPGTEADWAQLEAAL